MAPPPPLPPQPLLCVDALALHSDSGCDDAWLAAIADERIDDVLVRFLDDLDTLEHCAPIGNDTAAITASPPPLLAPTHTVATNMPTKPTPLAPKRKRIRVRSATAKSSWKRQKEEIAALRSSVDALTAQRELLLLHRQTNQHVRSCAAAASPTTTDCDSAVVADLKQRVQREVAAHQQATVESARLHRLAADALQMTRSMEEAIAKHPLPSTTELQDVWPELHALSNSADNNGAETIYRRLERVLDERCSERRPFVQHAAFTAAAAEATDAAAALPPCVQVGNLRSQVLFTHGTSVVANSWLAPFPADVVSEMLWRDSSMEELVLRDSVIKVVQRFRSTLYVRKHISVREPDRHERAAVFIVIKRYIDAQQHVTVAWESRAEWPSATDTANFVVHGHGWGVVRPVAVDGAGSASSASMFVTSTVLEPDVLVGAASGAQLSEAQSRLLVDAVVPTHQLGFAARVQTLENMLLELSIAPPRT